MVFKEPVSIAKNPKINQWLTLVEKAMRLNLATLLAQAVDGISKFNTESIDPAQYMQWVDSYQAQLVVLASQIAWSTLVEDALQVPGKGAEPMEGVLKVVQCTLTVLADSVLQEQPPVRRKKLEHLVSGYTQTHITHMHTHTRVHMSPHTDHRAGPPARHHSYAHHQPSDRPTTLRVALSDEVLL